MIAITGDSWGCGEWSREDYTVLHKGLEEYFTISGRPIVNASKGFIGNEEALTRLESILTQDIKQIIWFVTCALRGCKSNIDQDPFEYGVNLLKHSFARAENIAQKTNAEFFVVGGLCDVPLDFSAMFPSLRIIIPSSCSLFVDQYPRSIFGDTTPARLITNASQRKKITAMIGKKHDLFKNNPWFPDEYHLGRRAYFKLFQILSKHV